MDVQFAIFEMEFHCKWTLLIFSFPSTDALLFLSLRTKYN